MANKTQNLGLDVLEGGGNATRQPFAQTGGRASGNYRVTLPDGRRLYTDIPPTGARQVDNLEDELSALPDLGEMENRWVSADDSINEQNANSDSYDSNSLGYPELQSVVQQTRRHVPKALDYVEGAQHLRNNNRLWRWDAQMRALQKQNPGLWMKLQKHPEFQSFTKQLLGWKAGERNLTAAIRIATGKYETAVQGWLDDSVKAMMNRGGGASPAAASSGRMFLPKTVMPRDSLNNHPFLGESS